MRLSRIAMIALLSIVLISSIACGSNSSPAPTLAPGFYTFTHPTKGFSISLTDGWLRQVPEDSDWTFFVYLSQCGGGVPFTGVIGYEYADIYKDVQTYYSDVAESLNEGLQDYHLISKENLTIDSVPAIKTIFTYSSDGVTYQNMDCYLVKGQMIWEIRTQCVTTCWGTFGNTFETMADSFHIVD